MKWTARFVFWYYDEFDTTLANIYDVLVEAKSPSEAFEVAEKIVSEQTKIYSWPGATDFVSLKDENEVVYVLSNNRLVVLPEENYSKLPKTFCSTGETFFVIGSDKIARMRFPG